MRAELTIGLDYEILPGNRRNLLELLIHLKDRKWPFHSRVSHRPKENVNEDDVVSFDFDQVEMVFNFAKQQVFDFIMANEELGMKVEMSVYPELKALLFEVFQPFDSFDSGMAIPNYGSTLEVIQKELIGYFDDVPWRVTIDYF